MPKTVDPTLKTQKKAFASRLLTARLEAKPAMSQVKLAKMTGISNSTISNYEVGKTLPNKQNLKKLLKVLPALGAAKALKLEEKKPSIIEALSVHTESAKAAFMRTLVNAAPEMKSSVNIIMEQAKKANISQTEAFSMLGVLLEK